MEMEKARSSCSTSVGQIEKQYTNPLVENRGASQVRILRCMDRNSPFIPAVKAITAAERTEEKQAVNIRAVVENILSERKETMHRFCERE